MEASRLDAVAIGRVKEIEEWRIEIHKVNIVHLICHVYAGHTIRPYAMLDIRPSRLIHHVSSQVLLAR